MLDGFERIFFLGIKGVAMANLAVFLKQMGKAVCGVDYSEEFITDKLLIENNISWQNDFSILPRGVDLFVFSAAHGGINSLLAKLAKGRNIRIISQAELIGELMKGFQTKIAVAGCHGKTTTSSLLAFSLNCLGKKPSYLVGVPYFMEYPGAFYQGNDYFVVEADEYGINPPLDKTPKFFKLNPDWIIGLNIDHDHPDVYRDISDTKKAFLKFFEKRKLILNLDDENTFDVLDKINSKKIVTYGFSGNANYRIVDFGVVDNKTFFELDGIGVFKISLFGKHNVLNATSVVVMLIELGFEVEDIIKAIINFKGAKRRLELLYKKNGNYIFDDYAHHPKEIESTIRAVLSRFPNKKIVVVFQPHTFSRTFYLKKDFVESLSLSDFSFVLPIFGSAREKEDKYQISHKDIADGKKIFSVDSNDELLVFLKRVLNRNFVLLIMGAGDVYKLKDSIIGIID